MSTPSATSAKRPREAVILTSAVASALEELNLNYHSAESKENSQPDNCASHSSSTNLDHMIAELHRALTTKQRVLALKSMQLTLLQYQKQEQCLRVVNTGIVNAVTLQLHSLLHRHGSTRTELDVLCHCLYLICTLCHKDDRTTLEVFLVEEQGLTFVNMLTAALILEQHLRGLAYPGTVRAISAAIANHTPCVRQSVLSIFYIISATARGSRLLLQSKQILASIVSILLDIHTNDSIILEALGVLKNTTYYVEHSCKLWWRADGFVNAITALTNHSLISSKSRHRLSGILRNLATSADCRIEMVRQPSLIALLAHLLSRHKDYLEYTTEQNHIHPEYELKTQCNLLNTLISFAMDHESSVLLILHGDGILLRRLKDHLEHTHDNQIRYDVARTLHLLTNPATVPLLVYNQELMHTLSDAALRDASIRVRREAAEAFAKCAALVEHEIPTTHPPTSKSLYYETVLNALQSLVQQQQQQQHSSTSSAGKIDVPILSRDVLAHTLLQQAYRVENRTLLGNCTILIKEIVRIALECGISSVTAVQDACNVLLHLSMEPINREHLIQRVPLLLDALQINLASFAHCEVLPNVAAVQRDYVLETIVNLALYTPNRKILAKHGCLLSTLIQVSASLTDDELKANVKWVILLLTQEL